MLSKLPLARIFKRALKNGGSFSDIFFESTTETQITAENNRIEKVTSGHDIGMGLRVVYDGHTAYAYTNDITSASLLELADTVSQSVESKDFTSNIIVGPAPISNIHPVKIRPDGVPLDNKAQLISNTNKIAWGLDKRVRQCSILYRDLTRNISVANSYGEYISDEKIDTTFVVTIIASDKDIVQTGYEVIGGFRGFEFFDTNPPEQIVRAAVTRATMLLGARPAPTGRMPVVFSSEAGGTMIHEAVGHGLEADLATGGFSVYQNKIGKKVASPLVTVIDDGTITGKRGSFSFDDEGVPAGKNVLIENGVLKSYMNNRITAEKLGVKPTGNGRRESYRFRPIVRMTNTIIAPGKDDPDSILKDTCHGLFVKKMGGGQVNTITGDFVFEVQEGYIIKNGALGEPVRGATLSGNGPQVLETIDRVGTDLGYAIGTCGKDGQGVPVGDAQPTIRIPELIIGGTA